MTDRPAGVRLAILLTVLSLVYCAPLFVNLDHWGRQDWDQFTFRYATPRIALLRDHVLPTWNPYANGGTVLLAHPDSPVLSPWFLIVLLLDAPLGLRVQVTLFMILGTVGMALLLRRLGTGTAGCAAGGVVFMMSTHFALHITEGHLEWGVLGLMPWMALVLVRREWTRRQTILAGLLLASVLMFGSVHVPAVYLPFFAVWMAFESVREKRWRPLARWIAIVIVALLVSSVKLLPTIEFASAHPREGEAGGATPPALLLTMLADPRQASLYRAYRDRDLNEGDAAKSVGGERGRALVETLDQTGMRWRYQEYGAYIGLVGIILAAAGLVSAGRRLWPLFAAGAIMAVVALGASSPVDLWTAVQQLPFYEQFRVPSRFLAGVVFVLAVAAGCGARTLAGLFAESRRRRAVELVLVAALYLELMVMGWTLFGDIFVLPRIDVGSWPAFQQRFASLTLYGDAMDSNMYASLLSNSGNLDAYENLTVARGAVRTVDDEHYRGETFLERGRGTVETRRWTMSRIFVRVMPTGPDRLVVNQNYADGWRARRSDDKGNREELRAVRTDDGLIGVPVDRYHTDVELYYLPDSLVTGAWISGASLALCLLLLRPRLRRGAH